MTSEASEVGKGSVLYCDERFEISSKIVRRVVENKGLRKENRKSREIYCCYNVVPIYPEAEFVSSPHIQKGEVLCSDRICHD